MVCPALQHYGSVRGVQGKSGFTRGVRKAYWLADPLVPVQGRCVPSSGEECVQGRLFNCWCFLVIKPKIVCQCPCTTSALQVAG